MLPTVHARWGGGPESALLGPQEFNIEKLQMVEAEKQKIRKEYERKENQIEVKKKMCAPPLREPPALTRAGG